MRRPRSRAWRTALPWLLGWVLLQVGVGAAGRVVAARRDSGDEDSPEIRRVVVQNQTTLTPRNPELRRVELTLAMAGAEVDLTALPGIPAAGVDVEVRALMAGLTLTVPAGWTVWWESRGIGGIGPRSEAPGVPRRRRRRPTSGSTGRSCSPAPGSSVGLPPRPEVAVPADFRSMSVSGGSGTLGS